MPQRATHEYQANDPPPGIAAAGGHLFENLRHQVDQLFDKFFRACPADTRRINTGGGAYTSPSGSVFVADAYFTGGQAAACARSSCVACSSGRPLR